MSKLKIMDIVKSHVGNYYKIEKLLGSGGQGDVYEASGMNSKVAVKWYHPHMTTQNQMDQLARLVAIGSPSDKFLWPLEIVTSDKKSGFGYTMKLRSPKYRSVVDYMTRKMELNFSQLIKLSLQLVESFELLHKKGLCYQDISFGNFFIDEKTANILICDNDNVTSEVSNDGHILGTPRFMAPEVVRGESKPTILSDLFSLSILLFYLFMMHHPLEGAMESKIRCFDLPAMSKLYGTHPIFIFDPLNTENRPIKGIHDNAIIFWNLYPHRFKRAFIHSFTTGLSNSKFSRLNEKQWKEALILLSDTLVHCSCGAENFYEATVGYRPLKSTCWNCGKNLDNLKYMIMDRRIIMVEPSKNIWIQLNRGGDYTKVGIFQRHPYKKGIYGIINKSTFEWTVTFRTGNVIQLKQGETVNIQKISKIDFSNGKIFDISIGGNDEVITSRR